MRSSAKQEGKSCHGHQLGSWSRSCECRAQSKTTHPNPMVAHLWSKHSICGTFHVFKMAGWDKVPGTCKTPPCQTPPPSGSCVASNLLLFATHRKGNTEGVNEVNRPATTDEKYYWLPTKREKNYRLPTGKILTDYRYGPATLSVFRKKS